MGATLFKMGMDENGDGRVTKQELRRWSALNGGENDETDMHFKIMDTDGNGYVSAAEANVFLDLMSGHHQPASKPIDGDDSDDDRDL